MSEENAMSPISNAQPPKVNPLGTHAGTLKLKPVIRKPAAGGITSATLPRPLAVKAASAAPAPAAPAAPASTGSSLDALKSVTQSLKSATAPIPAQAILHKTGLLADSAVSDAQLSASKARTSRIALSDALGAAPVSNENAPMKTIRIKRPTDLPLGGPGSVKSPSAAPQPQPTPEAAPAAAPEAAAAAEPAPTVTQRKTLKISRPGSKVGIRRPDASTVKTIVRQPRAQAAVKPAADEVATVVAEIPDMPAEPAVAPMPAVAPVADMVKGSSGAATVCALVFQIAASLVMGFLAYRLYVDTTVSPF